MSNRDRVSAALFALAWLIGAPAASAAERTAVLQVANVSCVSCGPIVKRALSRVAGVSRVELTISGTTGTATVVCDDAVSAADLLVAATTNAGFPARLVQ
jgi:mercuric ion binding protein